MAAFEEASTALAAGCDLTEIQTEGVIRAILSGNFDQAGAENVLLCLRRKGETPVEVAAAARVLRSHMIRWDPAVPGVLDTCGTGGDGAGTFNISTAAAFVVAGAGVPVVKHGNRGVSSRSGSADVLEALGVAIECDAEGARQCLHEAGLAFCFAPRFHPAMGHVAGLRRRLGVPTIFNCLGPLANPASAEHQLLGVGRSALLDVMAGALARLGTTHSLVVCGRDGLDEVTLAAPTSVRQVIGNQITHAEWTAQDFGLPASSIGELQASNPAESARIIEKVLRGVPGPALAVVLANSAAGLLAARRTASLRAGVAMAEEAVRSGSALQVLERLRKLSATAR